MTNLTTNSMRFIVFIVLLASCSSVRQVEGCQSPTMGTRCITTSSGKITCEITDLCKEYSGSEERVLPNTPEKYRIK